MDFKTTMKNSASISHHPILGEIGVVALVPDVWGSPWRRRHQILSRLSRYVHVVWCNPEFSWRRIGNKNLYPNQECQMNGVQNGGNESNGFTVYQPERWLPAMSRPSFLARWTMRKRLARARGILFARGCKKIILYLWRPHFEPALHLENWDLTCYDINDEYSFSNIEVPIDERESRLISKVNQVIIHSRGLLEKKGNINTNTICVPNGVNYHSYTQTFEEPVDLKKIPGPKIGYVGVIKRHLDFSLMLALAKRHHQWSFVFIGPQGDLREQAPIFKQLIQLPNVYVLGNKPIQMLPAYTQHLDTCILCYHLNHYTHHIYPLKLHEYLASGRPVVGSPIRSLKEFSSVVRLAKTEDDWSQALVDSLSPVLLSDKQTQARRSIARKYDWDNLAWKIAHTLCKRLHADYAGKLEQAQPVFPPQ